MAFQTKDAVMMIVAFFLGLLIVSALFAPPYNEKTSKRGETTSGVVEEKDAPEKVGIAEIIPLHGKHFLALTRDGTLLLCLEEDGSLKLLEEYDVFRIEGRISFKPRKKTERTEETPAEKGVGEHTDKQEEGGER